MIEAILKRKVDGINDINLIMNCFLYQYRNTPHTTTDMQNYYKSVAYVLNLI